MFKPLLPVIAALAIATPALAADDNADWRFGGDAYLAGRSVTFAGDPAQDLFAAGDRVVARSEVEGSAHMAGRSVLLDSRVGGNFYGAGMSVDLAGPVAGNATLMGESVTVSEPVSGNLRLMGQSVDLAAPVAGSAVIGGDSASIGGEIGGDLALAATNVDWGDGARVLGQVDIYTDDPDSITVPASVAPAERVAFHESSQWDHGAGMVPAAKPGFFARFGSWIGSVLVVGVLATLMAALLPDTAAALRERALANPVRAGWVGFLGLSALAGSVVPLAMTGIGLLVVPVAVVGAAVLGLVGYLVGVYVLGVWATGVAGRPSPDSFGDRAIAAFVGAAIIAAVALVPWLGWLAVMALFLVGAGAVVIRLFSPRFMAGAEA